MDPAKVSTLGLAAAFAAMILTGTHQGSAAERYGFPKSPEASKHTAELAILRVFESQDATQHLGAATIVDKESGLAVTAKHVVTDRASVWLELSGAATRLEADLFTYSPAFDFAILKVRQPESLALSLEVQLDAVNTDEEHRMAAFGADSASVLWGTGTPAPQGACALNLRIQTFQGDSGSPMITPEGLMDAIVVRASRSAGSDTFGQMTMLPIECVWQELLNAIPANAATGIVELLGKGRYPDRLVALRPPPNPSKWITNLRLAHAVSTRIRSRLSDATIPPIGDRSAIEEIVRILIERRLGYQLALSLSNAELAGREAGDALQKAGDTLRADGQGKLAAGAYYAAGTSYLTFATSRLGAVKMWTAESPTAQGLQLALSYKAAADSLTKAAAITRDQASFGRAAAVAAAAAFHAPTGELRSSSLAAAAFASQRAGDSEIALQAYTSAFSEGYQNSWARKSYKDLTAEIGKEVVLEKKLPKSFLSERAIDVSKFRPNIGW